MMNLYDLMTNGNDLMEKNRGDLMKKNGDDLMMMNGNDLMKENGDDLMKKNGRDMMIMNGNDMMMTNLNDMTIKDLMRKIAKLNLLKMIMNRNCQIYAPYFHILTMLLFMKFGVSRPSNKIKNISWYYMVIPIICVHVCGS